MADKPSKIKMLYVPVYEHDKEITDNLPPSAAGQWARQLLLRQLQIDAHMLHNIGEGSGEEVTREEVKRVIQEELQPILAQLDDSMDKVIDEKLAALQNTLMEAVQEGIQSVLKGREVTVTPAPKQESDLSPAQLDEDDTHVWQRALGRG